MKVSWAGEAYEVRVMPSVLPRYIKVEDFILYRGEMCRVITVQGNCPLIENPNRYFRMVTLETRDGRTIPARDITGYRSIYRKKR